MKRPARRAAMVCALLTSTALAAPAFAQTAAPSVHQAVDGNGVDLVDGSFNLSLVEGSIGAGDSALTLSRSYGRSGWTNGLPGRLHRSIFSNGSRISVAFGNRAEYFDLVNGVWVPEKRDGATLTGSGSSYAYRRADGTIVTYGAVGVSAALQVAGSGGIQYCIGDGQGECDLLPLQVARPNGRHLNLHWTVAEICSQSEPGGEPDPTIPTTGGTGGQTCNWFPRLVTVANESNYLAKFRYAEDNYTGAGPSPDWFRRTSARLVNTAVEACDPNAIDCAGLTQNWPTIAYAQPSAGVTQITTPGNLSWVFGESTGSFTIQRPGSSTPNVTVTRANNVVTSVAADGVTTNYSRSVSGTTATMTVTNALNQSSVIVSDLNVGRPTSITNALNHTTSMIYDAHGRLTRTTAPEGNYTQLSYDARGNVTQVQQVAVPGSGDATITTSASYDAACPNGVTCNQPNSTTDARQNTTAYTYDQDHGGLLTVTGPAVAVGNATVQPQVRTTYSTVNGLKLPTQVSTCQTNASCIGTADEVRSTVTYGANNQPVSASTGNGAGTLTATSSVAYDAVGNVETADGPLAGSADTVRYRYDAARRPVGTVSADPDGSGPLPNRATRVTYRPDGQASRIESGIANGQSDADWAMMAVLEQADTVFDSNGRPVVQSVAAGGALHTIVQTSYDALGRADCTATRMNAAGAAALPASACTQMAAGPFGPDRIGRTVRDAAGRTVETRTAVGTPLEGPVSTMTWSANNRLLTVADGENNRTSYQYDGHGRLRRTYFPLAAQGATASNAADFEEYGYDEAGNRTGMRNRAGEVSLYSFDALGRMTFSDVPGGSADDVAYGYDLLGRLTTASLTSHDLAFTYDALGRQLTQQTPRGTYTSSYDLAGRRTRLTHPGGFFVQQDWLVTGELQQLREWNPATNQPGNVIASFGYDIWGRRTSLTRGNGTVTSYTYEPASRLDELRHDIGGTPQLSLGFDYNPAGQIVSNTRTNDLFSVTPTAGVQTTPVNGLNQVASVGGLPTAHDARGNMTGDGAGGSFGYRSDNAMTSANGVPLYYDPLGRLVQVTGPSVTRFTHDGANLVAEWDGANTLQRRYVYAGGELIMQYEGSGLSDRRYFHADERGSIVATSDSAAAVTAVNRYDEYGNPATGNSGRFQYTGQAWIPEIGLYYYRARMYNPRLGRFMQTDPIGYGDGMNMYAYVGGDPVNRRDPTGTAAVSCNTADTRTRMCQDEKGVVEAAVTFVNQHFADWSDGGKAAMVSAVASFAHGTATRGDVGRLGNKVAGGETELRLAANLWGEHRYTEGPNVICEASWRCTAEMVGSVYGQVRFGVPGNTSSAQIVHGRTYTVWAYVLPAGTVRSYVGDGRLTVANVTRGTHFLYDGWANRNASQRPDGAWVSFTSGAGTNYYGGYFTAEINEIFGPPTFRGMDRALREELRQLTGN